MHDRTAVPAIVPAISVIVPTYDTREMTLASCRAAIDALDGRGELVVSDDGSTDGTAEAVREVFPEAVVVRSEQNRGYSAAANSGAAAARGGILLFVNSDAFLSHAAVTALLDVMRTDPSVGIATPQLQTASGEPAWTGGREPSLLWLAVLASGAARFRPRRAGHSEDIAEVEWASGAVMAVRRSVWDLCGPFATRYRFYAQDLELCCAARRRGFRVVVLRNVPVVHFHGGTIASGSAMRHEPELLWSDLLTWSSTVHGGPWTAAARALMIAAAAIRIGARSLLHPWRSSAFRLETGSYVRALRGLVREPLTSRR